ncbi:MFS general substrate transporter [Meredithblackwellia eburnea MCA 4105]
MQTYFQHKVLLQDPTLRALRERHSADKTTTGRLTMAHDKGDKVASTESSTPTVVGDGSEERDAGLPSSPLDPEVIKDEKSGAGARTASEDPFLVDFPPGAIDNPQNWSFAKKAACTFLVAQIAFVVGVGGSINSAASEQAAADLGVSTELISLETALFLSGFGVASPLFGPIGELAGRSPVYIITLVIYAVFEIGAGFAPNIASRCVLRFLAGFWGSTPLANAGGTLADLWNARERTLAFCMFSFCGFLGPALGPVIGGFTAQSYLGYRWCDFIQAIWGGALALLLTLFLPETLAPVLLKRRAAEMRKITGDSRYETSLERARKAVPFRAVFIDAIQRPFKMMVLEPIVIFFSLYMSMVYIILFGDLVAFPIVFSTWELDTGMRGLCFLSIAVGLFIIAALFPFIYQDYVKGEKLARERTGNPNAVPEPESRLRLAMVGTWLVPISLFWFAWTAYRSVSIWAALASQVVFGIGILSCFISSYQYIIDSYLATASSALSVLTIVRYPISGGAVMFMQPMFDRLGNHWALTLLGFLSLLISLIPWVFYFGGPKFRSWSRYTPKVQVS